MNALLANGYVWVNLKGSLFLDNVTGSPFGISARSIASLPSQAVFCHPV